MRRRLTRLRPPLLALGLLIALPVPPTDAQEAAEPEVPRSVFSEKDRAEALAILKRSSDYLGALERFRFESRFAFDVVQRDGQKLEFGGSRKVTVQRPNRMRVEARRRDGEAKLLIFDGEEIWASFPDENAYASVRKPGTLDEALDYMADDLGIPAPLADLLYTDLYSGIAGGITSGFNVGEETIEDVTCDHLIFRGENADFQLWIDAGEKPLPRRVVITYRDLDGRPQFRARLIGWSLSPEIPDGLFAFRAPEGAERIPIVAPGAPSE